MASLKKVDRMLLVLDAVESTKVMLAPMMSELKGILKRLDEQAGAKTTEEFEKLTDELIGKALDMGVKISRKLYTDNFSDNEIDQMIAFYSSPVSQRLRSLLPEMSKQMATSLEAFQKEMTKKIEAFFDKHDLL